MAGFGLMASFQNLTRPQNLRRMMERALFESGPPEDLDRDAVDREVQENLDKLRLQRVLGALMFLPLGYLFVAGLKFWGGYRIKNHRQLRREFQAMMQEEGPMVICSNHLTYIDSAIIIWALAPIWWYALNYKKLSWNLPAGDHFKKKLIHRFIAFFFKCIYIHRDGSKEHKAAVLKTSIQLVRDGHLLTMFPEGKRSRAGRVEMDKITYGIGKLLTHFDGKCRVLCVYLRGDRQESYSNYPKWRSRFHMEIEAISPQTKHQGQAREAYADYAQQVMTRIKTFEDQYFELLSKTIH